MGARKVNLAGIQKSLHDSKPELRSKFKVKSIGIFGSYVRGEQARTSDLDILVDFNESPGLFEFVGLKDYLSELLGIKVDLVMKRALKPRIGKNVLEELVSV